jgi:carbonic anhydrase
LENRQPYPPIIHDALRLHLVTSTASSHLYPLNPNPTSPLSPPYSPYTNLLPHTGSSSFTNVLDSNAHWREKITKRNPDLLPSLATGQSPTILWIGCSDSRCPETTILGLQPGDVFVHRNIANILHAGDINSNAVIEYAVRHLGVKHVVLSGHTGCGGVAAALGNAKVGGVLDVWLAPLRKLRKEFAGELTAMGDKEKAVRLVELNVLAGVQTLKEKDVVIEARRKGELHIHGVVYEVGTGIIRELEIPVDEVAEEKTVEAFALKE